MTRERGGKVKKESGKEADDETTPGNKIPTPLGRVAVGRHETRETDSQERTERDAGGKKEKKHVKNKTTVAQKKKKQFNCDWNKMVRV